MYKPYVLSSPDFDPTSGGIRVMWGLYGWLLAKGQIAYMNRYPNVDRIAVYPEIVHGNPMGAKTVVRYLLNTPGVMGATDQYGNFTPGPTSFDPTDSIYVFSKLFDTVGVKEDHVLFLPILNMHLFKDQKKKRTKTCYLIGKGTNRRQHPEGSIELTREFSSDQGALADLLNECQVMYCYDKISAMMEVARLCGCRVMYYGEYDENELRKYEPGLNGIGILGEEKTLDIDEFRSHYVDLYDLFSIRLDQFIDETQGGI